MFPQMVKLCGWSALLQLMCLVGLNECLTCWHCIAENCDLDPESNFRAEKRQCNEGHLCQKVYFEMQSDIDDARYKSTVRSCAEQCEPRDDYQNCTRDLYITRGCVRRVCCQDDDLCNSAPRVTLTYWAIVLVGVGTAMGAAASLTQFGHIKAGPMSETSEHNILPCSPTLCFLKSSDVFENYTRFGQKPPHVHKKDTFQFDLSLYREKQFPFNVKECYTSFSALPYEPKLLQVSRLVIIKNEIKQRITFT